MVAVSIAVVNKTLTHLPHDTLFSPKNNMTSTTMPAALRPINELREQYERKVLHLAGTGALIVAGTTALQMNGLSVTTISMGMQLSGVFMLFEGVCVQWNKSKALQCAVWSISLALLVFAGIKLHQI